MLSVRELDIFSAEDGSLAHLKLFHFLVGGDQAFTAPTRFKLIHTPGE